METVNQIVRKFDHSEFGNLVTITDENGKVWMKATQVAKILGYNNPQKAIRVHCKGVSEMGTPTKNRYSEAVIQKAKSKE